MKQFLTVFFGLLCLASCDCYQVATGTVIDIQTRKPIEGITVYDKAKPNNKTKTDSKGNFELSMVSDGLFGCPPMTVVVEQSGYTTQERAIPTGERRDIVLSKSQR